MSFEDLFKQNIPTVEAASFFTELKGGFTKQAEWTDPPDMEGLLEGKFLVPVEQVLLKLKGVITTKYRLMVAYYTYAQSINDLAWRSMKDEFYEHAYDERCGAEFYTKRAAVLGGPVHLDAIEPPPASNNPIGILKIMIRAEQEGIAAQRELRQCVGEENPMRIGVEEHLLKDQHHLDELFQMLPKAEMQALELGGEMPPMGEEAPMEGAQVQGLEGEPPPAVEGEEPQPIAEEAPPEEKMASFRLGLALMKTAGVMSTLQRAQDTVTGRGLERLQQMRAKAPEILAAAKKQGLARGVLAAAPIAGVAGYALGRKGKKNEEKETTASVKLALFDEDREFIKKENERATAEKEKTKQLKEKGRERGVTGLAAEATREKGRRGERLGKTIGMLGGGAAGAALGGKYLGGTAGTLGGMAAGALAGRGAGSELGTEYDINKNASAEVVASMRMDVALHKLAQEPGLPGDTAGDGMASPATTEMQPQNYLASEMQAQEAQEGNEANYYREQLGQAQQTATMAQQQMTDVQAQLDQLQQQADQSGQQIQQAAQEAMSARDDAVNATMEVAKARIGAQKMRQQMLELASQDPATLGEEAMPTPAPAIGPDGHPMGGGAVPGPEGQPGAPPGEPGVPDAGMEAPPEPGGPAGAAPPPATAPGAAPPDGGADMTAPVGPPPGPDPAGVEAQTQLKTGSAALLGGLSGAALGAGASYMAGRQAPALRDRVQQLEGTQDGSFGQAAALATARGASAAGDLAAAHPGRAALSAGLTGGLTGSALGAGASSGVRELGGHLQTIGGAAKRHFGG